LYDYISCFFISVVEMYMCYFCFTMQYYWW